VSEDPLADFDDTELETALASSRGGERRFGPS